MKTQSLLLIPLIAVIGLGNSTRSHQNTNKIIIADDKLYDTLARIDSILFDAFNTCKYAVFNDLFTTDLEFYHDKGGLTDYSYTINSVKTKCGLPWKVRRELVRGSLEVYPVPGFGAIQVGAHNFYNTEKGPETLSGTFKFVHIWKRDNGKWRIARVASYGH
jgi:hypothetical protein